MNIRQAMLRTADHIERNPAAFDFDSIWIPDSPSCGTPGCAVGWMIHFMGVDPIAYSGFYLFARDFMGLHSESRFYDRMDVINPEWKKNAKACAAALRFYADEYHPDESRALIPESVARIFRMSHAELTRELA